MASNKRDFVRAFDTPAGLHLTAEPQASPVRYIPGQWPEEVVADTYEIAPAPGVSIFTTISRFATSFRLEVSNIPERLRKYFACPQQIIALPVIRDDGSSKRRLIDAGFAPTTPSRGGSQHTGLWIETPPSPQYPKDLRGNDSPDWSIDDIDTGSPPPQCRQILPLKTSRVVSPATQFNILRRSPVTPMRSQLLKKQLRKVEAVRTTSPTSPLEARRNQDADARTTDRPLGYLDPADVLDNDLSILPDADNLSSTSESLRSPSPSSSRHKSTRWASQGRVKAYYVDERISEMLDSTLESIRSPISKPNFCGDNDDGDSSDDIQNVPLIDPKTTSDSDESVDGPSLQDSSLFDSLEETELSKELLQDLEQNFKKLLNEEPRPPSPPKPLLAPLSDSERTQLEELAAMSKHGQDGCYSIVPDKITARDFGTLLPDMFNGSAKAWLNDEIVNQYLAILVKTSNDDCGFVYKRGGPAPPYHAFSSHWFNSIKGGVKKVERWASRVGLGGRQFMDAKVVLFPICDGSHWRLLAVNPQKRTIEYLDSLGWDGSEYIRKLRDYLQHELKDAYKEEEWTVVELQRSARQLNGSDCGVFVLLNALVSLLGVEFKKVVACNGMHEARERLAMTIITGYAIEMEY
ncbi:cysteine proteinase [Didymella exigua CBS 183.55]|uniref:Cysteine proteinase n=1 Tax=Didymella exigua CBS 183.55 TaxID=1150837 RepID=A0A6A5RLJ9_9PLEO|nr:cysteine proteinase [Didymella exigua CBS 183.55]KAF1927854.1 cysteine proteinase [Didymella exigua CBS 183.55]